jgi:hypothetical protein
MRTGFQISEPETNPSVTRSEMKSLTIILVFCIVVSVLAFSAWAEKHKGHNSQQNSKIVVDMATAQKPATGSETIVQSDPSKTVIQDSNSLSSTSSSSIGASARKLEFRACDDKKISISFPDVNQCLIIDSFSYL